jgi:3-oxoacyl-(acyl-carrier-protein) reductase
MTTETLTTEGRVALVTGGTRGIGEAIAFELARQGTTVAVAYAHDEEAAERLLKRADDVGWSMSAHRCDIAKAEDCERTIDEVMAAHGHVDYLVNNAGITRDRTMRKMSNADWQEVLDTNLSGAFFMTRAVLDHMVGRESGRIVNISSVIGETGNVGQANYAASKAGLFGLTKSLALETARKGVTVNCVAPGFVETGMVAGVPDEVLAGIVDKIPVKRLGSVEEVAHAVLFLLDDRASYITGSVIAVNGGLDM